MKIDNHVHIGVDPLFYVNGWSPYALDVPRLLAEGKNTGIDRWIVFPFVSYLGLDLAAMRRNEIKVAAEAEIPYRFENRRLMEEIGRQEPAARQRLLPFLMADPERQPEAQVREWETLTREHRAYGIKIQATIIQSHITALLKEGSVMLDFAAERNLPFLIHSSIAPDDEWSQCADILRVAEARPDMRFLLAHSCRFHRPSLDRVAELPNTWFDCSAHIIHCDCAVRGLPTVAEPAERFDSDYTSPIRVLQDLAAAYPDKLIWGSDAPFYSYEDAGIQLRSTYRAEVDVLESLPPVHLERAAHRNTLAWLGTDLKSSTNQNP